MKNALVLALSPLNNESSDSLDFDVKNDLPKQRSSPTNSSASTGSLSSSSSPSSSSSSTSSLRSPVRQKCYDRIDGPPAASPQSSGAVDLKIEQDSDKSTCCDYSWWDRCYQNETEEENYDWLMSAEDVLPYLLSWIPDKSSRILIVGCGNSRLSGMLHDLGYHQITSMDWNRHVIALMNRQRPDMKWLAMDILEMHKHFAPESFDVVIDKTLMDIFMRYRPLKDAKAMLSQIHRVLRKPMEATEERTTESFGEPSGGGLFLSISITSRELCSTMASSQRGWKPSTYTIHCTDSADEAAERTLTVCQAVSLPAEQRRGQQEMFGQEESESRQMDEASDDGDTTQESSEGDESQQDDDEEPESVDFEEMTKNVLRALYHEHPEMARRYLCDLNYWRTLSGGRLDISSEVSASSSKGENRENITEKELQDVQNSLDHRGFFALENCSWVPSSCSLDNVAATVGELKRLGWPPAFVLLYDNLWHLVDRLFDVMRPMLGGEELLLETDIFVWGLDAGRTGSYVGGNFALPHRDASFEDSNFPDGTPKKLSVWVPIVDVTLENGCIYVVPKDEDPIFNDPDATHYMSSATRYTDGSCEINFPLHCIRPLPAPKGSILSWQGNLIHWGSSCQKNATQPRISVAMTFVRRGLVDEKAERVLGRPPLTREQVRSLDLETRLSIIAKGLIMYSHWTPGFKGLDYDQLLEGIAFHQTPPRDQN